MRQALNLLLKASSLFGLPALVLVAAACYSLGCSSVVAGRSLDYTARNSVVRTAGMLHRTVAVAVDCSIVHIAVIDRNPHIAGMVDLAGTN